MLCFIYKSSKKPELYLYVPEKDNFSNVDELLFTAFGIPEFVMELELTPNKKLARADSKKVITCLKDKGYFVQMPPVTFNAPEKIQ